jgi:dihydroorotase
LSGVLIRGGRVIDPAADIDRTADIKFEQGLIVDEFSRTDGVIEVNAEGLLVVPGLIDMHVHLRDPGREDEETVESGARAAAAGGFTTIVCMPNTEPPIDSRSVVDYIAEKAARAPIDVKIIGTISAGLRGEGLSLMGEMASAGVVGFSDDGRPVVDSALMRRAMEYSKVFGLPIVSHCEDLALAAGGVMHEGPVSTRLGLKGIPAVAEEIVVARDVLLAELTGAKLHITHVSTAGSVEIIRGAKRRGVSLSADVTPHHLALTDASLTGYDANYKVNPPLRGEADRKALIEGLIDGTIDAIASDHAPHAAHEKDGEIETAPCGTIGLQTTVPVVMTHLTGELGLPALIDKLTAQPARILGLDKGSLRKGKAADVTLIDPKAQLDIQADYFVSKSRNSAFIGAELMGAVRHVWAAGRPVVRDGELVE